MAVFAVLVGAPSALADVTVDFNGDPGSTDVTVVDNTGDADAVTITQGVSAVTITRAGGGLSSSTCTIAGSDAICALAQSLGIDLGGGNDSLSTLGVSIPIAAAGGTGDDTLRGGSGPDVLAGGADNDTLNGAGGFDSYFGEDGNDIIDARDGLAERISCGAGNDIAGNDFVDIIAECERGVDADHDGFSSAIDCNDSRSDIHPGAPDPVENGIDEDCDGRDDQNLDRGADGFPVPADCNDNNRRIHPGAIEIRGNKVDENCDQRKAPFALLPSLVSTSWRLFHGFTALRKLVVRNAPAKARIVVTCKGGGCKFHKAKRLRVPRNLKPIGLDRFFGKGHLRPGARVRVAITASGLIGRTYTYRVVRDAIPTTSITCRAPGAKKGRRC